MFEYIQHNNNFSTLYNITVWGGLCSGPRIQPAQACGSKIPNAKTNVLNHCSLSYPVTSSNFSCFRSSFANLSPNDKVNTPHQLARRERGYQSTNMSHQRAWWLHSSWNSWLIFSSFISILRDELHLVKRRWKDESFRGQVEGEAEKQAEK